MSAKKSQNRASGANADLESNTSNASNGTNQIEAFDSPVRVHFHHVRSRLADIDGISGKAAIDGIVAAGLLTDDSAKQVAEVTHSQEKGKPEKTFIIIEEID